MRYARELDEVRASIAEYGPLVLVRGAIVLSWEKYAIHLIDALFGIVSARPVSVVALDAPHASLAVAMDDGSLLQLDALGEAPRTFRLDLWGRQRASSHEITDNFSMFRRLLWHFAEMIRTGRPVVPARDTLDAMRLLMAGQVARRDGRKVLLSELPI
jgi:predicted dehydrogenase